MPPERRKFLESDDTNKFSNKRQKSNMFANLCFRKSNKNCEQLENDFNQKKCISLFNEYASKDDKTIIEPEGIEKFCQDISVNPEDIVMLVLAWKMDCKQMGYFTIKEWLKGLSELQCDSLVKIKNKIEFLRNLLKDPSTFKKIYRYSFSFAKDRNLKSMDIDTAKAMLNLLLSNRWELFQYFYIFLNESKYKFINEDQWCNVLEFSRSVSSDLKNYEEDGAWPLLLDEFVDWYKRNK